uniref:GOLD domain-containing protein n=1 Tax=Parastrongyloides trichosuri TaxID=131310 RepID=A0A0N4ZDT2_PARTI
MNIFVVLFFIINFILLTKCVTITNVINGVEHRIGTTLGFEVTSSSQMNCFYETIEEGNILSVSLDVVNVDSTNLQFRITSPSTKFSEWYKGTQYVVYDGTAEESGDYEICTVAYVGSSPVSLSLSIVSYSSAKLDEASKQKILTDPTNITSILSERIQNVAGKIFQIYAHTRLANLMIKKDQKIQESNLNYLNTSTILQTIFIICCSLGQVYAIRKLFEINPRKIGI